MKIVEQIWKGMLVECVCTKTFFVESYVAQVNCPSCGRSHGMLSLLTHWFGVDRRRLEAPAEIRLAPVTAADKVAGIAA